MKCIFTVAGNNKEYLELAKVFVASARLNSNLDLHCLYDGPQNHFTSWLSNWGVPHHNWQVTFLDEIRKSYTGKKTITFCAGTYLRVEIPKALKYYNINDRYIFFVDVDTLILNNIQLNHVRPEYFAATPDWNIADKSVVGTGVMVINTEKMLNKYDAFINHLKKHNFDFAFNGAGPCSQGAYNTFFKDKWGILEAYYDWKPWWGFNPNARIVHFSGPKPKEISLFISGEIKEDNETDSQKIHRFPIEQDLESYSQYLKIWNIYKKVSTTHDFCDGRTLFKSIAEESKTSPT